MGIKRCFWVNLNNPLYVKYHDLEWGVSSYDDKYLFEMLLLEMFQAGLSWECILNKRESFRLAFDNFDYKKISLYDENKINLLLNNKNIIRNRRKINAVINNSRVFINIQKEYGSFSNYIWSFTNGKKIIHSKLLVSDELSDKISRDLKNKGMKFVGTIIIYSYLQAIGIIDDHDIDCDFKNSQI